VSVLVVLEQHRMSWEALAAAQQFAQAIGTSLEVAAPPDIATQAASKKAAKVYSLDLAYTADAYAAAMEALVR